NPIGRKSLTPPRLIRCHSSARSLASSRRGPRVGKRLTLIHERTHYFAASRRVGVFSVLEIRLGGRRVGRRPSRIGSIRSFSSCLERRHTAISRFRRNCRVLRICGGRVFVATLAPLLAGGCGFVAAPLVDRRRLHVSPAAHRLHSRGGRALSNP